MPPATLVPTHPNRWFATRLRPRLDILRAAAIVGAVSVFLAPLSASGRRLYRPAELTRDLEQLLDALLSTHPRLEYTANVEALHAEAREIREQLRSPLDVRRAWMQFARMNPLFRDAHVGVQYPVAEFTAYRQAGGAVFPLPIYVDDADKVRVAEGAGVDETAAPHEEIVAINGRPMQDFLRLAMPLMRGETATVQKVVLAYNFAAYLWTLYGGSPSYEVVLRSSDGKERHVLFPRTTEPAVADAPSGAFRYERVAPDVGYLEVRSFDIRLQDSFRTFLAESFSGMRKDGIRKLIIDVRRNPGGAHDLSDELIRYLTGERTRQASAILARIVGSNRSIAPSAAIGDVVTVLYDEWLEPGDNPHRFTGRVLLLIGRRTYSQAIVFAATFQDFRLGRVAGEPTDGWANQTGQVQMAPLRHTRLQAAAPLYILYRPSGDRSPGGVRPDIAIADDPADPRKAVHRAVALLDDG